MIPALLDEVTVDEVVRAGACVDGVRECIERLGLGDHTVFDVNDVLAQIEDHESEYLLIAAGRFGYGYGYGNGDGGGYSNGYGYGDGGGYGNGYGNGN